MSNKLGLTVFTQHDSKFLGMYRAKVEDNSDPLQLGRIKARIYPMFADIEDVSTIPWAVPAMPVWDGSGTGTGFFAVPDEDTYVFCFFEAGDVHQPVYFAEAPTKTVGLPDSRTTNYPDRKVLRNSKGTEIYVDDDIMLNPNSTHRSIVNAMSFTVKTYAVDHTLDGDDGGLVLVDGAITLTLPSASAYEGMVYVFKKIDTGATPATISGDIEDVTSRLLLSKWDTITLISNGSVWVIQGKEAPVGSLLLWTTNTAPSGYLLCYGQAVSRTTYAALFSVIGSTFGSGDGSSTFNVPDLRGRVPLGKDDMGGTPANRVTEAAADTIGGSGGEETHTLTIPEIPSHTHEYTYAGGGAAYCVQYPATGQASTANTGSTGGGLPHNNLQPYITLNYIIKF